MFSNTCLFDTCAFWSDQEYHLFVWFWYLVCMYMQTIYEAFVKIWVGLDLPFLNKEFTVLFSTLNIE